MAILRLSKSSVGTYFVCPFRYKLQYVVKVKSQIKTDYWRLLGSSVHKFIDTLLKPSKNIGQRFYYQSNKSAKGAWFYLWKRTMEENRHLIRFVDQSLEKELGITGWICILNYMNQNHNRPDPIASEKRVEFPILSGVHLVGVFDQLRTVPMETITRYRSDLVRDDSLIPGYDPIVIVDLKTNKYGYNIRNFKPDATDLEQAAYQFDLHEDLQVLAYHWLYFMMTGRMPVGFFWYHLRSKEFFFSYRTSKDFNDLFERINHVVEGINSGSYPKVPGNHCKSCDFLEICAGSRDDRPMQLSLPENDISSGYMVDIDSGVLVEADQQLRFPSKLFKVARKRTSDDLPKANEEHNKAHIVILPRRDHE